MIKASFEDIEFAEAFRQSKDNTTVDKHQETSDYRVVISGEIIRIFDCETGVEKKTLYSVDGQLRGKNSDKKYMVTIAEDTVPSVTITAKRLSDSVTRINIFSSNSITLCIGDEKYSSKYEDVLDEYVTFVDIKDGEYSFRLLFTE